MFGSKSISGAMGFSPTSRPPDSEIREGTILCVHLETSDPGSVCAWYFFNVRYNLANKMVLRSLDAVSVGWFQLAFGTLVFGGTWACS